MIRSPVLALAVLLLVGLAPGLALAVCPNAQTSSCIKDDGVVLDTGETLDEAIANGSLGGGDNLGSNADRGDFTVTSGSASLDPSVVATGEVQNQTLLVEDFAPGVLPDGFVETFDPTNTVNQCTTAAPWFNKTTHQLFICTDGTVDTWDYVAPVVSIAGPTIDFSTPCSYFGEMRKTPADAVNDLAICVDPATDDWEFYNAAISQNQLNADTIQETTAGAGVANTQDRHFFSVPQLATLIRFRCNAIGGTSVTLMLRECSSSGITGTCNDSLAAPITCTAGANNTTNTFADGSVDTNDWMVIDVVSVVGTSSTVTYSLQWRPQ